MRRKLTLALILALITLVVLPTAFVKRTAARTGPSVGIDCMYLPYGQIRCVAQVYGGTAPYSYQWGPPPLTGSGQAQRIPCSGTGTRPVTLTVTDANGEVGYYSDMLQCCPTCHLD